MLGGLVGTVFRAQNGLVSVRRLVVGGGRACGFPRLKAGDLALNRDPEAMPDLVGDVAWAPLASGVFEEVCFEKLPFAAFTGDNRRAIKEAVRVLRPGGRLIVETGWAVPGAEVRAAMRQAGLRYVKCKNVYAKGAPVGEVRRSFVRFTGRLRKR